MKINAQFECTPEQAIALTAMIADMNSGKQGFVGMYVDAGSPKCQIEALKFCDLANIKKALVLDRNGFRGYDDDLINISGD